MKKKESVFYKNIEQKKKRKKDEIKNKNSHMLRNKRKKSG